eukprot:10743542-Alexandrium_andersonii.AAC.1
MPMIAPRVPSRFHRRDWKSGAFVVACAQLCGKGAVWCAGACAGTPECGAGLVLQGVHPCALFRMSGTSG